MPNEKLFLQCPYHVKTKILIKIYNFTHLPFFKSLTDINEVKLYAALIKRLYLVYLIPPKLKPITKPGKKKEFFKVLEIIYFPFNSKS